MYVCVCVSACVWVYGYWQSVHTHEHFCTGKACRKFHCYELPLLKQKLEWIEKCVRRWQRAFCSLKRYASQQLTLTIAMTMATTKCSWPKTFRRQAITTRIIN